MEPRKPYPSDVSREQFESIRPILEGVRKRAKPRTVDLQEVFNAVLYLLKSGCQWRMLPEGFPNWVIPESGVKIAISALDRLQSAGGPLKPLLLEWGKSSTAGEASLQVTLSAATLKRIDSRCSYL